jgi:two-component system NtrC family sensor kinase
MMKDGETKNMSSESHSRDCAAGAERSGVMKYVQFPSRWSFQARVLVPVVAVIVLVVAATVSMLNNRVAKQFEAEAVQSLLTSDAVFQNSQKIRTKNLYLRFGNIPNEPHFKAVAQVSDANTMRLLLRELVSEVGADFITYQTIKGLHVTATAPVRATGAAQFESYASASAPQVLKGQTVFNIVTIDDRIVQCVSIPVLVGQNAFGALTLGTELGDDVALEFHQLTGCEVTFFANNKITATTLPRNRLDADTSDKLVHAPTHENSSTVNPADQVAKLIVGNKHMLGVTGHFKGTVRDNRMGYALLASYEQPLATLRAMQRTLLGIGAVSIALATLTIWGAVRRITQPLRQLRDVAVAIGKGDFSQRVESRSADECGQLAAAFNSMTGNLAAARQELERTVETLRTTRARLTQSEKLSAVGEFVAGVTHELNNPLTSIIGFAELLQRVKLEDAQRRQVDLIAREATRCRRIVQSLLSFARQHKPERKPVRINDVLDASIDILAYQLRTSNVVVERRLTPNLPLVIADQHHMQQVFINLLNNARQAVEGFRNDGKLRIATRSDGDWIEVEFHDNGPGIAAENLAKIFDPFFTTKEVGKGTGLGLSLCYGTIQEHGGSIEAKSEPGDGARFIIRLPVAKDAMQLTEPGQTTAIDPATEHSRGQGKRVLVVDDEDSILSLARELLTRDRYDVDICSDGETALRKAAATRYDAIICDWKMPGLTGRQVYEQLCESNPEAAQRFIFMTGDVISETALMFLEQHHRQCLRKPFSLVDFSLAIDKTLDVSRN